MATVIDALTVTLGLDASKFKAGTADTQKALKTTSETATRAGKDMEASGKQAAQFFSTIKTEAISLATVLLGGKGIQAFTSNAVTGMAALGREAKAVGMSVRDLAAFELMIRRNGGSAESAAASMRSYSDQVQRWQMYHDNPQFLTALQKIGASPDDTPIAAYMKFIKFADENKGRGPLVRAIGSMIGYDGGTVDAAIQIGSVTKAVEELSRAMRDIPSKKMADDAAEVEKSWRELEDSIKAVGNSLLADAMPGMKMFLGGLTEFIHDYPNAVKGLEALAAGILLLQFGALARNLVAIRGLTALLAGGAAAGGTVVGGMALGAAAVGLATEATRIRGLNSDGADNAVRDATLAAHPEIYRGKTGGRPDQYGDRATTIAYFTSRGWSPAQAAGIADAVQSESGFNAGAYNPGGGGRGARGGIQWRGDRIKNYRAMFNRDPNEGTYEENMQFIQWELTQGTEQDAGNKLKKAQSERDALTTLNRFYTRPDAPYPMESRLSGGKTDVHIGQVTVTTQATDAKGIARDLQPAISNAYANQANRGLQ